MVRNILRLIWVAAGLALVLGCVREPVLRALAGGRVLASIEGTSSSQWFSGGFRENSGVYPSTTSGLLPAGIATAGSWIDGDVWQGRAETAWIVADAPWIRVGVAGYPQHAGCKLWAEFRSADGALTRVDCHVRDPREEWSFWEIRRPAGANAVRIMGEDFSDTHSGWLAFSQPYAAPPALATAAFLHAQVFTTLALALTLVCGPGLLLGSRAQPSEIRSVLLIGSGPLLLAAGGVVIWVLGGIVKPQTLASALVTVAWLALGVAGWQRRWEVEGSVLRRRLLAVIALVAVAIVAKSSYSIGPQGELFRGTISRNFEVSDRLDSRYGFHVAQLAAHHRGPATPAADNLFKPWTFFSRGPLAGLATIPIVMATGGEPHTPPELPGDRWSPFDRAGFAAYRITMIVLASTVLAALFLVLVPLAGERWAFVAVGLVALSPFGLHEILFTWPKWAATAWLLASFGLAHARRPLGAGVALGVGYLFHPLVLLWAPWLALWAAGRAERNVRAITASLARFGTGAVLLLAPWWIIGAVMPHVPEATAAGQSGFLQYWARADWHPATWSTWWQTRWMNFANTFAPLHVYLADSSYHHPRFGNIYEPGTPLVKFSFVWWNSLPFAMGLGLWALSLAALARAFRILRAAAWLLVVAPALFVVAYWGMDPLGLMRECGHPLFVTLIALTCVVAAREESWLRTAVLHRAVPWLQLPEAWLMLWLTTLANAHPWPVDYDQLDVMNFGINALALGAAAWVVSQAPRVAPSTELNATTAHLLPVS